MSTEYGRCSIDNTQAGQRASDPDRLRGFRLGLVAPSCGAATRRLGDSGLIRGLIRAVTRPQGRMPHAILQVYEPEMAWRPKLRRAVIRDAQQRRCFTATAELHPPPQLLSGLLLDRLLRAACAATCPPVGPAARCVMIVRNESVFLCFGITDKLALLLSVKRQVFCMGDRWEMDKHKDWNNNSVVAPKSIGSMATKDT